jgi:ribokinase
MAQVYCLGSLNLDFVYQVDSIVSPGQTIKSLEVQTHLGGKGGNQSIALARAGANVSHIGSIGADGIELRRNLESNGVNVQFVRVGEVRTGHAIIQVQRSGQNAIIVEAGANGSISEELIRTALETAEPGDWLLAQNETNLVPWAIEFAKKRGVRIAYNPSPFDAETVAAVLPYLDLIILNETEGRDLTGESDPLLIIKGVRGRAPRLDIALTLGGDGAYLASNEETYFQPAQKVTTVDTTGAGDTFLGYLLGSLTRGIDKKNALERASRAAAVCVTRRGAAASIPLAVEIDS